MTCKTAYTTYIDDHFHSMSAKEKMVFRLQASEAIAFIHSKDVIHSDQGLTSDIISNLQ